MASGLEITCANKNPHGVIVRVGGQSWSLSVHEAIVQIATRQLRLHIFLGNECFDIGVRGDGMDAYLVIEPDEKPLHKVEGLPSC